MKAFIDIISVLFIIKKQLLILISSILLGSFVSYKFSLTFTLLIVDISLNILLKPVFSILFVEVFLIFDLLFFKRLNNMSKRYFLCIKSLAETSIILLIKCKEFIIWLVSLLEIWKSNIVLNPTSKSNLLM